MYNVAPQLEDLAATTYISGTGVITVTGGIVDLGTMDTFTLTVDWEDGSSPPEVFAYAAGTANFMVSHQYLEEQSVDFDITLTLEDDDLGSDEETLTVPVRDSALDLTDLAVTPVLENETATLSGTIDDVGASDAYTLTVSWGDGEQSVHTYPAGTTDFSATHQYLDDKPDGTPVDSYTVTLVLEDDDGGVAIGSTSVTVTNVAPVLSGLWLEQADIDENGQATLYGSFSDVGTEDSFVLEIDWGDGSSTVRNYVDGSAFVVSHQYPDDDPSGTPADDYDITVTVTDDDTGSDTEVRPITVHNVAPEVYAGADISVGPGTTVDLSGIYTDVGTLDTHTVEWDFGDGTTISGTLTPSHDYPIGVYIVNLTVTDDDTGTTSDELIVTVEPYKTFLPLVVNNFISAPDLVVESITATASDVQVVVVNQGGAATAGQFWVDVYIDPDPAPTRVNQLWQHVAQQGLVWGITVVMEPGDSITLSFGDEFYSTQWSDVSWPLGLDLPVYAQVDAWNDDDPDVGAILENHEILGLAYNNIDSTIVSGGTLSAIPDRVSSRTGVIEGLPSR